MRWRVRKKSVKSLLAKPCEDIRSLAREIVEKCRYIPESKTSQVEKEMAGVRQAPGGVSSICLGLNESELKAGAISSNAFASNTSQNSGNFLTERPSTTLLAPPGGRSTICLGEYPEVKQVVPPGGKSSICLGLDAKEAAVSGVSSVSSNAFASGKNQNSGNVLTDRPTTLLHAPPGGYSTIRLGHDDPEKVEKLEPRPVGGEDHITWAPAPLQSSTGHRVPAGGKSTICLGENEIVTESPGPAGPAVAETQPESTEDEAPLTRRVPAGGEWILSSRALGHSSHEEVGKVEAKQELPDTESEDQLEKEESLVEIEEAQPQPDEGVILGVEKIDEDKTDKTASKSVQSEMNKLQDLPTPARRAPPGGVATVLLG